MMPQDMFLTGNCPDAAIHAVPDDHTPELHYRTQCKSMMLCYHVQDIL